LLGGVVMGKIIWMAIPTFILISVLSDVFERLQKGHIGEFILGFIVMGGLQRQFGLLHIEFLL
jgi:hypothetical protein